MSKVRTIISGVAWTIIYNAVSILYGIVSVPFLISYFGKEEYGLISIALSINVYISLLDMGMTNCNIRYFSEYIAKGDKKSLQKLFNLTHLFYLVIGVINTLVLFGVSFFVENLFNITANEAVTLRNLLWVLALNATFSWISTCYDQLLRADDLLNWIKRRSSILKLLQFLILFATITFKFPIEVYFAGYIFIVTTILPFTIYKAKTVFPDIRHLVGFDSSIFNKVYPYALNIFSFSIFQFCAINFRPLFLGGISGPVAVAEFSVMNTIVSVVTIISGSFMQVLLPIITKMRVQSEQQGILTIMNTGTKYVVILVSTIIFLLILNIEDLLLLYVGKDYLHLVPWLSLWLATLLLSHRNVITSLVFTECRLKSVAVMGATAMVFAIISYINLIPIWGVGGVVVGFLIHELIHTLFYYIYFIPKKFKINTGTIFFKSVFPIWIAGLIVIFVVSICSKMIEISTFLNIVTKSSVFVILFGVFVKSTVFSKQDFLYIKKILKR